MAYAKFVENDQSVPNTVAAEKFLLEKVYRNTQRAIGTELEVFVVKEGEAPRVSYDDLMAVTDNLCSTLQQHGHTPHVVTENSPVYGAIPNRIVYPDMGIYCFEPGGQYEMAVNPASTAGEAGEKLLKMYEMLEAAAKMTGAMRIMPQGHHQDFFVSEIAYPRTRFTALYNYYDDVLGDKAFMRRGATNSCCGFQVNLDAGADKLHEFQAVLTVLDPVLGMMASNGPRKNLMQGHYSQTFPQQTFPLVESLFSNSPEETVHHIVNRLSSINLPIQPDSTSQGGFVVMRDDNGRYPTIGTVLNGGQMTEASLLTCLSQQLYGGNLRGNGAILETRGPDSTDPHTAGALIPFYSEAVYNDGKRDHLLKMFRATDQKALSDFLGMVVSDPSSIRPDDDLGGQTVQSFVNNVMQCLTENRPMTKMAGYNSGSPVFSSFAVV